jgi:hypothetical protein
MFERWMSHNPILRQKRLAGKEEPRAKMAKGAKNAMKSSSLAPLA